MYALFLDQVDSFRRTCMWMRLSRSVLLVGAAAVQVVLTGNLSFGDPNVSASRSPTSPPAVADDDTPWLIGKAKAFGGAGGVIQLDCRRRYQIKTSLDLSQTPGVTLRGCLSAPDDPGSFRGYAGSFESLGGIVRAPEATIIVGRDSGLENVLVRQSELSLPAKTIQGFSGTAIATPAGGAGQAALLHNVLVIGAETCFDDANGGHRLHIDGLYCDGLNGEVIGASADTSVITNVHNWPFATSGAQPVLRPGVGFTLRGQSDDTVLGTIFDFGHRVGFFFDSHEHGIFHVTHLWADNNAEACVRVAGGRGINIASLTTYTCGVSLDLAKGAEVQISQAFIVAIRQECIRLDGTLSIALLHLEQCGKGGIRIVSLNSVLSLGFLHVMTLSTSWAISVPPGFTSDHVGIGKFFTDAPAGSSLYDGHGPTDPILTTTQTLDLPPNGESFQLAGSGIVQQLRGGWGGRIVTFTSSDQKAAIAAGGNVLLASGVAFGGRRGGTLKLRYDATTSRWREESRSAP